MVVPDSQDSEHISREAAMGHGPRNWSLILPPIGNLWWQRCLGLGIKLCDQAVLWRTGTVSCAPSLLPIAASLLICSLSWLSGTTIGPLHVACTKERALSYAAAWPKSPPTG